MGSTVFFSIFNSIMGKTGEEGEYDMKSHIISFFFSSFSPNLDLSHFWSITIFGVEERELNRIF